MDSFSKSPRNPSTSEAEQFAIMLSAGLPAEHAICYFIDTTDAAEMTMWLNKWARSKEVAAAQKRIDGKDWTEMSIEEKIDKSLNKHYADLAYFLRVTNYLSAGQVEKAKLDSARAALETKKAGQAGRGDALSRFFDDLKTGVIRLPGEEGGTASGTVSGKAARRSALI